MNWKESLNEKDFSIFLSIAIIITISTVFITAEDAASINGFQFNIKTVDGAIKGEDGIIITSNEAAATAHLKYCTIIHCEKVEDNLYRAISDSTTFANATPLATGEIYIAIHSASSNVADVATYPNVLQKNTAVNVKSGMYFVLTGIDVATKTTADGIATVYDTYPDVTPPIIDNGIMGTEVTIPSYKLDVVAPATYKAGATIIAKITIKDIATTSGITLIHFFLYYDKVTSKNSC